MKIDIKDGIVTNDGAELGIIQDGTCHLTQKVAPVIKGEIRKVSGNPELKFLVGEAPDNDEDEKNENSPVSPPVVASNPHDPKPKRDPVNGDKCPKLIAWKQRQQKGGK